MCRSIMNDVMAPRFGATMLLVGVSAAIVGIASKSIVMLRFDLLLSTIAYIFLLAYELGDVIQRKELFTCSLMTLAAVLVALLLQCAKYNYIKKLLNASG